jgi:hypothetical protein
LLGGRSHHNRHCDQGDASGFDHGRAILLRVCTGDAGQVRARIPPI